MIIVLAVAGAGCAGAPLGGRQGSGGSGGGAGDRLACTPFGNCPTGSGGAPGTGGGSGGATCSQLAQNYSAALTAAATCTPGAPNQCQALADPVLEPCDVGCRPLEPVNDATATNVALKTWAAQCATGGCPAQIPCMQPPVTGTCVAADGGGGICVALSSGAVTDAGQSCEELGTAYENAVSAARSCTPGAPNQCQALVDPVLEPCDVGCRPLEPANDATAASAALKIWAVQCATGGCPPQIPCRQPSVTGTCVAADGGGGICVAMSSGAVSDASQSCEELATVYQNAVSAARSCTPGAPNQCQAIVDPVLEPCDVDCRPLEPVNDATAASAALKIWAAQCATGGCPAQILCVQPPVSGTCVPGDGGGGICVLGTSATD